MADTQYFLCPEDGERILKSLKFHHGKSFHNEEDHHCPTCNNKFKSNHAVGEHMSKGACSTKIVECSNCYKNFKHESNLRRHVQSIHHKKMFHCAVCGIGLSSKDKMKDHYKRCKTKQTNHESHEDVPETLTESYQKLSQWKEINLCMFVVNFSII